MKDTPFRSHDIDAIQDRLPHRYPFLFVDRILDCGPDHATALKNVSMNEPFFQGHFPGYAVMPAVLITEACLQAAAFIGPSDAEGLDGQGGPDPRTTRFLCVGVNMKFTGVVRPGDQLRIEVRMVKRMGAMSRVRAKVFTDSGPVANGDLSLATKVAEDTEI